MGTGHVEQEHTKGIIMSKINISFVGRVGQAPTLRRVGDSGFAVTEMRVAVNRREKRQGEWVDAPTTWFNVVTFGNLAEEVAETWNVRDEVYITGELITEEWTDRNTNETRTAQKVRADRVEKPQVVYRRGNGSDELADQDGAAAAEEVPAG